MDKGMDHIAQDVKDIVQTRTAIADKLDKLEHRFTSTVEEAKMMAEDFADRAQAVVEDTVESVKEVTDPSRLASNYPWLMVSGAIMTGFAVGRLIAQEQTRVIPYYPPGSHAADVMPESASEPTMKEGVYPFYPQSSVDESSTSTSSTSSPTSSILTYLGPLIAEALEQVRGDLVEIGKSTLRTWLKEAVQGGRTGSSASTGSSPSRNHDHQATARDTDYQPHTQTVG
ncbi:MAG: hypothetical protein Nkreftii_002184 [Candidatus Nitrospira kreftii]|uniref:DUF3618 domain-containing protein n=1 Tax=Candidatus Nitrospira kreftii TaxID=2652173 RepID=A0A7S8IZW4_9BACT|nr:MAG: hypothetical protein Nkreftii_002184 [Candidatus Nitrospira kreftii]